MLESRGELITKISSDKFNRSKKHILIRKGMRSMELSSSKKKKHIRNVQKNNI
jgi:hypothetical protein